MRQINSIEFHFQSLLKASYGDPPKLSAVQYQSLREAYYGGVVVYQGILLRCDDLPCAEQLEVLDNTEIELAAFHRDVKVRKQPKG